MQALILIGKTFNGQKDPRNGALY